MMKNFYVDPNTYDLVLENNNIKITSTVASWLSAKIEARLKTFYGEWFANQSVGVPYFEEILKKQVDLDHVQVLLGDVIKETNGVDELVSFEINYSPGTRVYAYSFVVMADSGETVEGAGTV